MDNWKTENLAKTYLEGVRGAIPFAAEEIDILLRIINHYKPDVKTFLDLGCGDGILGRTILVNYPDSKGIFVDFSEPMINAAKSKSEEYKNRAEFFVLDFGNEKWIEPILNLLPVDLVISGFAIHHQDDNNKKRIYNEIFNQILKSGGLFLNLEQTASSSKENEKIFDEFFMDYMKKFNRESGGKNLLQKIEEEYYKDKEVNKLSPVEEQCNWLREIGFVNVDCFFKVFEISIFGGVKP